MSTIAVNPSIVLQGTLTFVAAIAISDATREIIVAMKPSSVYTTALLKTAMAVMVILVVILIIYHSPKTKSPTEHPMIFPPHEIFRDRRNIYLG